MNSCGCENEEKRLKRRGARTTWKFWEERLDRLDDYLKELQAKKKSSPRKTKS